MSHPSSQAQHVSLYHRIGVDDFSSISQIRNKYPDGFSEHPDADLRILDDVVSKDRYDFLLEAMNRPDGILATIPDVVEQIEILRVAQKLNIKVVQQSDSVFRVINDEQVQASPKPEQEKPTAQAKYPPIQSRVGGTELTFSFFYGPVFNAAVPNGFAFRNDNPFADRYGIVYSNSSKVIGNLDDSIIAVVVGLSPHDEHFLAAYINQTAGVFSILEFAGDRFFGGTPEDIAFRFRIRNRPDRIRNLIRGFYLALADVMAQVDANVSASHAKQAALTFFKKSHPY